uniref:Uncharacterized protein n=1 Tax=Athene cunicularia TaxID=194338 RepID=A0A663N1K4_ATHCN
MERANTITYLKGETIGTETRKKGNKEYAATGLFPKNINRLHVTQLSIVCPFKYLVYMKRQREERPKKIYYTGHEVKSFKEYNIPLRNNKCNLYRTRGRIPLCSILARKLLNGVPLHEHKHVWEFNGLQTHSELLTTVLSHGRARSELWKINNNTCFTGDCAASTCHLKIYFFFFSLPFFLP